MNILHYVSATLAALFALTASAAGNNITDGRWNIKYNETNKTVTYIQDGKVLVKGAYVTALDPSFNTLSSTDYPEVEFSSAAVDDAFGTGTRYTYRYKGLAGKSELEHSIYIYPRLPYLLVEAAVVSDTETSSTNICPIVSQTPNKLPWRGRDNRIYNMPFANDNWATFSSVRCSTGQPVVSCEATAIFSEGRRTAIVIGSVDHSTWKSAVSVTPQSSRMDKLQAEAGYISERTWDRFSDGKATSERHGAVKGTRISSPRFMLGLFDDWRTGMETYGEANTALCPKMEWTKDDSLFGWQSWGGMEWGLNYNSAMSVLDFFEKELKPKGFHNKQGRCLMVLDSGWDALNDEQLRSFAGRCKELGFVPGIYSTPFSYWGGEENVKNDMWEGCKLSEMVLKAGGKYRKINGFSLDPTHPAVKEWNRKTFERFRNNGFEFVKIDFMNNGSQEADSWYDKSITTGLQAYNYGMDYVVEFAGDMMLDYSIAPIFPAKAHVRRIGCDAWGDLPQSMYTLNCINGSWWLDRVYAFNDPDHMTLSVVPANNKGSRDEQEARIRYTCGLITGMTLLGGTYAYEGDTKDTNNGKWHVVGNDDERARVASFAANTDLTAMGRLGKTFRPVEGTFKYTTSLFHTNDVSADNEFVLDTPTAFYYVVFNYESDKAIERTPDFDRLGINASIITGVKELWTSETYDDLQSFRVNVPAKDVRIYRFDHPDTSGMPVK